MTTAAGGVAGEVEEPVRVVAAVVQTAAVETSYRRAGRGRSVLLLVGVAPAGERERLFMRLAAEFRVVEPEAPRSLLDGWEDRVSVEEWSVWIRGVIDGLGLDRPALAADATHAPRAEEFARADPGRSGPVVRLETGDPEKVCAALRIALNAAEHDY